jgi:hypothetical protein
MYFLLLFIVSMSLSEFVFTVESEELVAIYDWMAQLSADHELQLTSLQVPEIVHQYFSCWSHLLKNSISRARLCRGLWKVPFELSFIPAKYQLNALVFNGWTRCAAHHLSPLRSRSFQISKGKDVRQMDRSLSQTRFFLLNIAMISSLVCFNIMDEFNAGELNFTHFVMALDLFTRIYVEKPVGLETFALSVFSKAKANLEDMISFDQIKSIAFDSQLIVDFFDIGLSRL